MIGLMVERDVGVFDRDPEAYHRARPGYSDDVIDFVVEGLPVGARALEVACGTGYATLPVLDRGLSVTCVDRGARLLEFVAERTRGRPIEFVCARFQDFEPEPGAFDLVYVAQAWHWLGYEGTGAREDRHARVARALKPDGRLAIIQCFVHNNWTEADDLYRKHWPGTGEGGGDLLPAAERLERMRAEVSLGGHLVPTEVRTWRDDRTYTAQGYVDWLATTSDHGALPPDVQHPFFAAIKKRIEEQGGTIVRPYEVCVIRARRRDG